MDAHFSEKLCAAVPRDFHAAAFEAARREGVTLADLIRRAVGRELSAAGIAYTAPPTLRRTTFLHRPNANG